MMKSLVRKGRCSPEGSSGLATEASGGKAAKPGPRAHRAASATKGTLGESTRKQDEHGRVQKNHEDTKKRRMEAPSSREWVVRWSQGTPGARGQRRRGTTSGGRWWTCARWLSLLACPRTDGIEDRRHAETLHRMRSFRFGEALRPGPYTEGGASSSGHHTTGANDYDAGGTGNREEASGAVRCPHLLELDGVGDGLEHGHTDDVDCSRLGAAWMPEHLGGTQLSHIFDASVGEQAADGSWAGGHIEDLSQAQLQAIARDNGRTSPRQARRYAWDALDFEGPGAPLVQEQMEKGHSENRMERTERSGTAPATLEEGRMWAQLVEQTRAEAEDRHARWKAKYPDLVGRTFGGSTNTLVARKQNSTWKGAAVGYPRATFRGPELEEQREKGTANAEKQYEGASEQKSSDLHTGGRDDKKKKRGGRRRNGVREVEIWSINTSGKPQLEKAVAEATKAREQGTVVVGILNQEHQQGKEKLPDLQAWVKQKGWSLTAAEAVTTNKGGESAGVAIVVPRDVPAGVVAESKADLAIEGSRGRAVVSWLQHIAPGGVMLASVYMWHTEGGTPRNTELLQKTLQAVTVTGCPWIVGLDANDTPAGLASWAAPLLAKAGGRIVSTGVPTNYPSEGEARNIDYYLVAEGLAKLLRGIRKVEEVSTSPHRAVALQFHKPKEKLLQWTIRTPKAFPRQKPTGCARAPHAPAVEHIEKWQGAQLEQERRKGLADAWGEVVSAIEVELCGVTDRFRGEEPDQRFCGRAAGPRYVQASALPPRISGKYGDVDPITHALLWARNRLCELGHLADIATGAIGTEAGDAMRVGRTQPGIGLTEGQRRQWETIVDKYISPGSPVRKTLGHDRKWEASVVCLKGYRQRPSQAACFLHATHEWVDLTIHRKNKEHSKGKRKGWELWLATQMKNGAGGLHAWVKRAQEKPEEVLNTQGVLTAAPCDIVECDFNAWQGVWNKLGEWASTPWRNEEAKKLCNEAEALPAFGASELRRACRTFSARTGWGIDNVGPRQMSWLSDELLEKIAALLRSMERGGIWPGQLQEALIHLIPKATSGRRPIGLVSALPRIWERVRKPVLLRWRQQYTREYNWMSRGRGAERAVWAQSVEEEAARFEGKKSTAVLVDLVKAFEQVTLGSVWEAGVKANFPVHILRLGMEMCMFRRRLVYRRAMSEETVSTATAILAGLGVATDFMFLKLVRPLDQLQIEFPSLRMFLVADDVRLGVQHHNEDVLIRKTDQIAKRAVQLLEGEEHMQVSRGVAGKTVALASTTKVKKGVGKRLKRSGIGMERATRNLGVDFTLHKGGRRMTIQTGRWIKAKLKTGRLKRVGGRAGMHIAATTVTTSITYGTTICGMTDGLLAALRTFVARTRGKLAGRSTTARLLMEGVDPGEKVIIGPVRQWVEAWWDGQVSKDIMQKAWRHAIVSVGMAPRPNAKVQGGAGALFASLRRLGWTMPSPETLRTRCGTSLFFGEGRAPEGTHMTDPRSMRRWLANAHEIETIRTSAVAKDINCVGSSRGYGREKEGAREDGGAARYFGDDEGERKMASLWRGARYQVVEEQLVPWIWPLRCVYRAAMRKGRVAAAASFRACVEGAWWTSTRLQLIGAVAHDKCKCGIAAGTLWHKLGRCNRTSSERETMCPDSVLAVGRKRVWDPLFARGVPARPKVPKQAEAKVWFEKLHEQAEFLAEGVVYTDGSAEGWHWLGVRAGYGAVCYNLDGTPQWVMRGVCGEPHASIVRAELTAVLKVLKVTAGRVKIKSDNAFVVQGFKEGKEKCQRSATEAADIWRDTWEAMGELGGTVEVDKVKAHAKWADVVEGRVTHMDYIGNTAADKAAKEALAVAKREAPANVFNAALATAVLWGRWVVDYASAWDAHREEDNLRGEEAEERAQEERRAQASAVHRHSLPHELWTGQGSTVCRRCGRHSTPGHPVATFGADACRGVAAGRVRSAATGNINHIWATYMWTEAQLAARGLAKTGTGSVPRHLVDETRLGEEGTAAEEQGAMEGSSMEGRAEDTARTAGGEGQPEEDEQAEGRVEREKGGIARPHALRAKGLLTWCDVCGAYSTQRAGRRIKGECVVATTRHRLTRLERLRAGRHPISGVLLA